MNLLESVKVPVRQMLLVAYAFAVNKLFEWAALSLGFVFTEEQKVQIVSWGTPLVYFILSLVDKLLHEIEKAKSAKVQNKGFLGLRGLTGF